MTERQVASGILCVENLDPVQSKYEAAASLRDRAAYCEGLLNVFHEQNRS